MSHFDLSILKEVVQRSLQTLAISRLKSHIRLKESPLLLVVLIIVAFQTFRLDFIIGLLGFMIALTPVLFYLFINTVATRIEQISYPNLATRSSKSHAFFISLFMHSNFLIRYGVINAFLYLFHSFGIVYVLASTLINGALLGKEFFRVVAERHLVSSTDVRRLTQSNKNTIRAVGVIVLTIATLPLIGFMAPFFGILMMVHLFHVLRNREVAMPEASAFVPPRIEPQPITSTSFPPAYGAYQPFSETPPPPEAAQMPPVAPKPTSPSHSAISHTHAKHPDKPAGTRQVSASGNRQLPTGKRFPEKYSHVVKKRP